MVQARAVFAAELLTWKDVVTETMDLQPDLKGAVQKIEEARYDEKITKSSLLPKISASSSYSRSDSSTSDWKDSYGQGLSGSLLLFDGLKTPYAVKAARKKINQGQFAYAVTSSDVLLNVRTAFVGLMEAQAAIKLNENIRDRKKQNLQLVELLYQGGKEHKGAYLTAEAELAQAELGVREAERSRVLAQRKLFIAMGTEKMADIDVTGTFQLSGAYAQKPDLNTLLKDVPFLKQLAAAREEAQLNQRSAKGSFWPTVSASTSVERSGGDFWGNKRDASVGLTVSIPLFEGGKNKATAEKSHASFLLAQATEESGRQQVLLSLEDNWKSLKDAVETVGVRQKFLYASEERAKIADAQYGTGLMSFDDWIIIENNLVSAQKNYLSAQAGMLTAEAGWIHALGGTLDDQIY